MSRKILISRGFGAGWSTWNSLPNDFICEYQPIIEAIESGENLTENHPAVESLVRDALEMYGEDYVCLLGLDGLTVVTIGDDQKYRVTEYDGAEGIETMESIEWN